jgi:glycosyltransferase involved in cell wall biosynthesis
MEPRKNYAFIVNVFNKIAKEFDDIVLVIVGKKGWLADMFFSSLSNNPLYSTRIFWFSNISDNELSTLYRQAYIGILPSLYEGYGLPAIEMLRNGCVTLASNAGSLPEVAGTYADFFSPNSNHELYTLLYKHLTDNKYYQQKKISLQNYNPPRWEDSGKILNALLIKHFN